MSDVSNTAGGPADAFSEATVIPDRANGMIAARIDRLPVGWTQWRLVLLAQMFWGAVVGLDPIIGRLYPVVWKPAHSFTSFQYQLLLGFSNGLGPLLGNYSFGFFSDRYGRRKTMILACLVAGILYIPLAFLKSFPILLLTVTLAAFGVGAAVSTAPTYTSEISPPNSRTRLMLGGTILAFAMLNFGGTALALWLLPKHPTAFVLILALIPIVVMIPLIVAFVPESPRWQEGKGRYAEADRTVSAMERMAMRRHPVLAEPDVSHYRVPVVEKPPFSEVFKGRYLNRTVVLLIVWVLVYAGLDYGYGSYVAVYILDNGMSVHNLFITILIGGFGGVAGGLAGVVLSERVERKVLCFASGVAMVIGAGVLYHEPKSFAWVAIGLSITTGAVVAFLSNLYNYTATSYPTRLRALGVGWTDGVGHLGAVAGPLIAGQVYSLTASHNHWTWFVWFAVIGSFLPGVILLGYGIDQRDAVLEEIST